MMNSETDDVSSSQIPIGEHNKAQHSFAPTARGCPSLAVCLRDAATFSRCCAADGHHANGAANMSTIHVDPPR